MSNVDITDGVEIFVSKGRGDNQLWDFAKLCSTLSNE